MKIIRLPEEGVKRQDSQTLQNILLDRVIKLRKLNKEMNENAQVQKAQDALNLAKAPFKKTKLKWLSEIEQIEIELKSRDIKYNIRYDDIFEDNDMEGSEVC